MLDFINMNGYVMRFGRRSGGRIRRALERSKRNSISWNHSISQRVTKVLFKGNRGKKANLIYLKNGITFDWNHFSDKETQILFRLYTNSNIRAGLRGGRRGQFAPGGIISGRQNSIQNVKKFKKNDRLFNIYSRIAPIAHLHILPQFL